MSVISCFFAFVFWSATSANAVPGDEYIKKYAVELKAQEFPEATLKYFEQYKVIAVGEHHGSEQIPRIIGALVEQLVDRRPVTLALEIPQVNQKDLDKFLKSGGEKDLKALPHFNTDYKDGRSSQAMADLIKRARQLENVKIFLFDPDEHESGQDRDTKMAENIVKELKTHPQRTIVALAGNVHSSMKVGNIFDSKYKPMAYELFHIEGTHLKQKDVLSIKTRYEVASIWACSSEKAEDCGPMDLNVPRSTYTDSVNYLNYFLKEPQMDETGYLSTLFLRRVSPSEPF